jgi:hypothetical protein
VVEIGRVKAEGKNASVQTFFTVSTKAKETGGTKVRDENLKFLS